MSESSSLKRPHFFSGKLITPEDLALEQQYFRERLKRHNRSLHGFGVVSGLKVSVSSGQIVVEPGLALDCEGNELAIETAQSIALLSNVDRHLAYLNIRYIEENACLHPSASAVELAEVSNVAATITESFEFAFTQENCNRGHRHLRARWLACGQPHALTLAKVKYSSQGWRIDRGYRPPTMK